MTRYKYYCNERPAGPGAVPSYGFDWYDPNDKGGKYGAVYYKHELTTEDLFAYELKTAGQVQFNVDEE